VAAAAKPRYQAKDVTLTLDGALHVRTDADRDTEHLAPTLSLGDSMSDVARVAVAGSTVVIAVLVLLTALRKVSRDRREIRWLTQPGVARPAAARIGGVDLGRGHHRNQRPLGAQVVGSPSERIGAHSSRCHQNADEELASLTRQVHDRRPVHRGAAILLLGLLRDPDCLGLAAPALRDRDSDVRLAAARANQPGRHR
jgi:hypothetical protein